MLSEFEHTTIHTNGIDLHVVLAGPVSGPPLILLHGFPEFWYGWRNQIPALAAAGFRLIVPDQRGYNISDVPKDVSAYAIDELSKDVIGLLDHFGLERAFLVGHDWGAAVAWHTASLYPQRIKKLGILNVPHPAVMLKALTSSPRQMLKSWYIGFFQIPGLADWLMKIGNFAGAANLLRASGKSGTFSDEDLTEYRKAWKNSDGLTGMINWYRALMRQRSSQKSAPILKMPVLILWGKRDGALSFPMAEASLMYCENGKLIPFEDATHWVQHDQAEAVTTQLIDFLKA